MFLLLVIFLPNTHCDDRDNPRLGNFEVLTLTSLTFVEAEPSIGRILDMIPSDYLA